MVVITGLTLIASIAMPNLWRLRDSLAVSNFVSDLRSFGTTCRDKAITTGTTLAVSYDEANRTIRLHSDSGEEPDAQNVATLVMPQQLSLQGFRIGAEDSTSSEWTLRFYPDGRAEAGGFELLDSGRTRAWVVASNGSVKLDEGSFPVQTDDSWPAGEYERRL